MEPVLELLSDRRQFSEGRVELTLSIVGLALAHIMAHMESNVFESQNRAVIYLDLLGFAALVEANPEHFMTELVDGPSRQSSPTNAAAYRLSLFHRVLESHISSEQPNYAVVFSDCAFGAFYTLAACADFAVALMGDFLRVKIPVRMGLAFGTFRTMGTTSELRERSTVVRAMFGGTSIVRAVAAETCGGKGMRIFVHSSFSKLFDLIPVAEQHQKFLPLPKQLKSVSREINYVSKFDPKKIEECVANVKQMANSAPAEVQNHYSDTLAALSRMLGYNVENIHEDSR